MHDVVQVLFKIEGWPECVWCAVRLSRIMQSLFCFKNMGQAKVLVIEKLGSLSFQQKS